MITRRRRGLGRAYWQMDGGVMGPGYPPGSINRPAAAVAHVPIRPMRRRGLGDDETLSFPQYTQPTQPTMGQQWTDIFKSILPAGMTTLQEFVAQPGQTIKTPTTLITGSGTNLITGGAGGVSTGVWILGGIALLGVVLMSSKR